MAGLALGRDGVDGLVAGADVLVLDYRSDMLPVPLSVEAVVRRTPALDAGLAKGAAFVAGPEGTAFTVVDRVAVPPQQQGVDAQGYLRVVGLPTAFLPLIRPASRPTIRDATSLAEVIRASGAAVPFSGDVPLTAYANLIGHIPTYSIAATLQEEAAGLCWQGGRLVLARLAALFRAEPVLAIPRAACWWNDSPVEEAARVPFGFGGADVDGVAETGRREERRRVELLPRADARRLNNLSRVLVRVAIAPLPLDESLTAGMVVMVDDERLLVLTAAHRTTLANVASTRLWLSRLSHGGDR